MFRDAANGKTLCLTSKSQMFAKQCLTVWPRHKTLPGQADVPQQCLNLAGMKQEMFAAQCFVMRPNGKTLCLTNKSLMFDKQCLSVVPGLKAILIALLPLCFLFYDEKRQY